MSLVWLSLFSAYAQSFGEVGKLWEHDASGRWKSVKVSTQAVAVREGGDVLLEKGMAVNQGEVLRADLGMAEIVLASGNQLRLDPGAEVVLREPTFIEQLAGEVLYEVKGMFSVSYGTVHCTVEGTAFEVVGDSSVDFEPPGDGPNSRPADSPPGTVAVIVLKGKVRVTGPAGDILVKKQQRVVADPAGTLGEVEAWKYCALCGYSHVPH